MTPVREALEPPQITMSDIRLIAGEGKLSAHDVLAAVNGHLRMHWKAAAPGEPCAWLRDVGVNASDHQHDECLVPAAKGDHGAFPVYRSSQPAAGWDWLPIEHRPLRTGTYLVGHRGYQEIMKFFGPDVHWVPGTQMGWLRLTEKGWQHDDPAERFKATHCIMIQAPGDRREAPAPAEGVSLADLMKAPDWNGDLPSWVPDHIELPKITERGIGGQIMDAAWGMLGGNNLDADFWYVFSLAMEFTLRTRPDLLNGRDDFIVSKGLWTEFTDTLPRTPPSGGDEAKKSEGGKRRFIDDHHETAEWLRQQIEPDPPAERREIVALLRAIKDGFKGEISHGYITVENPDATPQSIALGGVDPCLSVSADAILAALAQSEEKKL